MNQLTSSDLFEKPVEYVSAGVLDEQPQFSGGSAPAAAWFNTPIPRFGPHRSVPYDIQETVRVVWGGSYPPIYPDEGSNTQSEANSSVQVASCHARPRKPQVIKHASLKGVLTDRRQWVLDELLRLFEQEAIRHYIPLARIEISGYEDPEEDFEEVVITHWVRMSPSLALDYWDKLGNVIMSWKHQLPDELAVVLADNFAVEVRWETNG